MFGKKREKEIENFGDKDYSMKEHYNTKDLIIANLQRVSNDYTKFGPMLETTEQKYIFEKITIDGEIEYREVFTGYIVKDVNDTIKNGINFKYFNLPYVYNPEPFTNFFPKTIGIKIPKLSLIWTLNDINYSKEKSNSYQLKK